jgi:hypothetical protein
MGRMSVVRDRPPAFAGGMCGHEQHPLWDPSGPKGTAFSACSPLLGCGRSERSRNCYEKYNLNTI